MISLVFCSKIVEANLGPEFINVRTVIEFCLSALPVAIIAMWVGECAGIVPVGNGSDLIG